jgi:homoserine O-acetyltransferase
MEKHDHTFHYSKPFQLESGEILPGFQLRYTTLGKLNEDRSNVVWVCHALTGSSDFTNWWDGLFSDPGPFDPNHHLIICANALGGCYGSIGPLSINPATGKPYYHTFPLLTNRDVVRAFDLLREHLLFNKIQTLIGGSLGGQQVLEWAYQKPEVFEYLIPIACNAFHSPWGIAFNEAQRMAIASDPTWAEDDERAGITGMKAARAIAMLSYRHYTGYALSQSEKAVDGLDDFRAASYQQYQGEKLARRFNAFTYWTLSKMMDSHQLARNRKSLQVVLNQITCRTLVIGIDSDILFPVTEQQFLAEHIPNAEFKMITSHYGHDGFLVEYDQLKNIIKHFFHEVLTRT